MRQSGRDFDRTDKVLMRIFDRKAASHIEERKVKPEAQDILDEADISPE